MDRTLVLLRHAKAEHTFGVDDPDRALTDRGHRDAEAAGVWLAEQDLIPDLVLCSPARRTRETWHEVALALGAKAVDVTAVYEPGLYGGFDIEELIERVAATEHDVNVLMLIGHNPTLEMLSRALSGTQMIGLHTSGIAVHRADAWSSYAPGQAPLTAEYTARG